MSEEQTVLRVSQFCPRCDAAVADEGDNRLVMCSVCRQPLLSRSLEYRLARLEAPRVDEK